jgi:hypothetical protein
MKTLRGRKYGFHILTQFSQGIDVLDPHASSIDSSYKTYSACFIHINGAVWHKRDVSHI